MIEEIGMKMAIENASQSHGVIIVFDINQLKQLKDNTFVPSSMHD